MSVQLFHTAINSPILITLIGIYFLSEAISTFDTRIIQAKKNGYLHNDAAQVPQWTGFFAIFAWLSLLALIILSWKFAILVYVVVFILKALPVMENIGAFLLLPIVGKDTAWSVNIVAKEQNKAAKALKALKDSVEK